MNESQDVKDIELLPLRDAMDYAQSLESRGDFKFKGIYAIFNAVLEATSKFNTSRILPDVYQLQRELSIPKEKFDMYIKELIGRGSVKTSALLAFPSLDYISGGNLSSLLILCRPLQQDGTTYRKYYDYYKNRTVDAIKKWMQKKESKWEGQHREYILKNLNNEEDYFNSHAGAVIQYYLTNPFDINPDDLAITYRNFVKPIIQALINDRILLYLKEESNFYTLQFPDEESLVDRFKLVVNVLRQHYYDLSYEGEINYKQLENFKNKVQNYSVTKYKNLFLELKLILNELIKINKQKEEQQKKQMIQKVLEELSRYEQVIPSTYIKSINQENFYDIISSPEILHTEYVYAGRIINFLLYKKNIYPAVVHARKQLIEKHDDLEMKVLMQMDIGRLLEGEQLKVYLSAEEQVLFMRLPLLIRIFRILFGKTKVKNEEKEKLKEQIRKEEIEKQVEYKRKEATKKTKEIARKKVEDTLEEKPQVDLYEQDVSKLKETVKKDEKVERLLEKIFDVLDQAWDNKELPNRITLLDKIEEFQNNEDYLIQFLKKYGKGKIFSFRIIAHNPNSPKINLNDPKYVWPVLITKRYILRHGHKLLKEAMDEVDEQKKAIMPDQEKFDIAVSIEDFLNRILNSMKKK